MKIFFDTVGCRLNQAEIERMAAEFKAGGHEIVASPGKADMVIVNTCAVTAAAASDSRQKARQASRAGAKNILLTGCWATVSPRDAALLENVTQVIANDEKDGIPQRIMGDSSMDLEPMERNPLPGIHRRTRAFIKVQDGCDNHCTFCITRIARGESKSVGKENILQQVLNAEAGGRHEIVLSGVNLGAWGRDMGKDETLRDLIQYLLDNSRVERVRLSSIEPWDMDERFLELWQDARMCRHFHIPLQSGCVETLKRMGRRTTPGSFREMVTLIRERIPDAAITTDIIVGFAGETEEEFAESLEFVKSIDFAGGHVFRFSPREGTPAASLPARVHGRIAHERSELMREAFSRSELAYWQRFIGKEVVVLWESSKKKTADKWFAHGLTDNYLPVMLESNKDRGNRLDRVKLTRVENGALLGGLSGE